MAETKIQWADYTFNPWIGCTKVHTGCANCYAEADMDKRRGRVRWGPHGTRSRTSDDYWKEPLKWNRQAKPITDLRKLKAGRTGRFYWKDTLARPSFIHGTTEHHDDLGTILSGGGNMQMSCFRSFVPDRPRVFCASLADVFEDWDGPSKIEPLTFEVASGMNSPTRTHSTRG